MENIRKILNNAKMANVNMDKNLNSKELVNDIFNLIIKNKEKIKIVNEIDKKNQNGFNIEFEMINKMQETFIKYNDSYRKVIYMNKNENNFIEGLQTDNLGTICLVYDGNTYCMLEIILKTLLTHNSLIIISESNYMQATNELIIKLIANVLEKYEVDKNIIQIEYTTRIEELLSNNISINKVIVVGDRELQNKVKNVSKIETIGIGYNAYDIYIEDTKNIELINKILKENQNIDVYVKNGKEINLTDAIKVENIDEAIAQINFSTSGYSSTIFTNNSQNASEFLKEVKTQCVSVNSSPLINSLLNIDINEFLMSKKMIYPSPFVSKSEKNKIEFPIKEKTDIQINEKAKQQLESQLIVKEDEIADLKRQLEESQNLANKYMNIFKKSFFSRLFGRLNKKEIENDTKLLS